MNQKISYIFGFALLFWLNSETNADSNNESGALEANIAYFIQVSESTLPLVPRLLRSIWHRSNLYIIHYDKKIPQWQRDYSANNLQNLIQLDSSIQEESETSNIRVMEPEVITYRGISMVINTMNAMQVAIDSNIPWEFFINISGSDYPLVSATNQRILLGSSDYIAANRSFLTIAPRHWWSKSLGFRATRLFTDTSLAQNGTQATLVDSYCKHPLASILGYEFVAAESWMILHRDFVHFVLTSPVSRRYFAAFSYISEPEEHFFATIAYNEPPFNDSMIRDAMRQVIWKHEGKRSGQHPYYVDKLSENGDWTFLPAIRDSGSFFTRKISKQNSPLLDIIDSTVSGILKENIDETSVEKYLEKAKMRLKCMHPIREIGLHCRSEWIHT